MPEEVVQSSNVKENRNPHGYGDPEDKTLLKRENYFIRNKVRDAAKVLCADIMEEFAKCATHAGLKVGFKCQNENKAQYECLKKWLEDEHLYQIMTEEYLEDRTRFRLTGVSKPINLFKRH